MKTGMEMALDLAARRIEQLESDLKHARNIASTLTIPAKFEEEQSGVAVLVPIERIDQLKKFLTEATV